MFVPERLLLKRAIQKINMKSRGLFLTRLESGGVDEWRIQTVVQSLHRVVRSFLIGYMNSLL